MVVISQAPAAAPITNAAAATSVTSQAAIFNVIAGEPGAGSQLSLNAPGSNRLNGQPFRVRAAGLIKFSAGTYTATVQPLIYASTTAGFTAAASNAILSAAAVNVVVSAAVAKYAPWYGVVDLSGDSSSGTVAGQMQGAVNANGTNTAISLAASTNPPTSVNFASEPPLQFAAGVTIVGGTQGSVVSLSQFQLEA
jgi:hypothetical protein